MKDRIHIPAPSLPIGRYRFTFTAQDPVRLPEYAGSAWRGAFGHALKRLVCVTREPVCADCLLYRSCLYPYVFETPPDPAVGKMRRYNAAPHPFVLLPGTLGRGTLDPGAELSLHVTLFGRGNRHLPYVIHALDQAGQRGMGRQGGRLSLQRVEQETGDPPACHLIYEPGARLDPLAPVNPVPTRCPGRFALTLETPLRIKANGRHVTPESFRFGVLFAALLRRISMLTAFHTDTPLETDFAGLTAAARAVEVHSARLRWHEWTRYSSRQDALLQMGGLRGTVTLAGSNLAAFWPYLWLGQWTHLGKGTSMGLGRYRIQDLSDPMPALDQAREVRP